MALTDIEGIGPATEGKLAAAGIATVEQLAEADPDALAAETGLAASRLVGFIDRARARRDGGSSSTAEPKLLAGGNPQIPKGDGDGPVAAYIEAMPGWKHEVGRWLDDRIERTVSDVRKAVRWNSPFYGVEGQGWFLSYHCFTNYVKVTFFRGTSMEPMPPEASTQDGVRYLHVHEDDELEEALVTNWIRQAASLPGEELF